MIFRELPFFCIILNGSEKKKKKRVRKRYEQFYPITEVKARQILDSRGNPTIEAEVKVSDYIVEVPLSHPVRVPDGLKQ